MLGISLPLLRELLRRGRVSRSPISGDRAVDAVHSAPSGEQSKGYAVHTVLIANRGEIAVRVARACRDAGLRRVAVYADPDRDALHVRMADEAFALGGTTPGDSYLVIDKLLDVAARSPARTRCTPATASCPRTPTSPRPCIDAGLTWIGPTPQAIRELGDKVTARHIALRVGAPLVPGTSEPGRRRRRGRRVRRRSTACRWRSRRRSAAAAAA